LRENTVGKKQRVLRKAKPARNALYSGKHFIITQLSGINDDVASTKSTRTSLYFQLCLRTNVALNAMRIKQFVKASINAFRLGWGISL